VLETRQDEVMGLRRGVLGWPGFEAEMKRGNRVIMAARQGMEISKADARAWAIVLGGSQTGSN
jgi:hypothetical protein